MQTLFGILVLAACFAVGCAAFLAFRPASRLVITNNVLLWRGFEADPLFARIIREDDWNNGGAHDPPVGEALGRPVGPVEVGTLEWEMDGRGYEFEFRHPALNGSVYVIYPTSKNKLEHRMWTTEEPTGRQWEGPFEPSEYMYVVPDVRVQRFEGGVVIGPMQWTSMLPHHSSTAFAFIDGGRAERLHVGPDAPPFERVKVR